MAGLNDHILAVLIVKYGHRSLYLPRTQLYLLVKADRHVFWLGPDGAHSLKRVEPFDRLAQSRELDASVEVGENHIVDIQGRLSECWRPFVYDVWHIIQRWDVELTYAEVR